MSKSSPIPTNVHLPCIFRLRMCNGFRPCTSGQEIGANCRRSPNCGMKNSWQEAHSDSCFSRNSSFKMESHTQRFRPNRQLKALDPVSG
jgi:hypothetical protein